MANGTVLNFQGNAYLSDGTSQSTSKDADGTVTFNGAFGGSTITLNDSASHYAFLYFPSGGTLNANNITFSGGRNNINAGGAISTYGGFTIGGSNIAFTNNWAHNNGGASGGAISGNDISLNASDITFTNNTGARSGGAIWSDGNVISTGNLWFYNNHAGFEVGIGYGGAIRTQNFYVTNPDAVLSTRSGKPSRLATSIALLCPATPISNLNVGFNATGSNSILAFSNPGVRMANAFSSV